MAWDLCRWAESLGATTGNLDLRAGNVELFGKLASIHLMVFFTYLRRRSWVMNTELLDTEEVFARRDAGGDGGRVSYWHTTVS